MAYLYNLYKYIYYNFCIYKDEDDNDNYSNNEYAQKKFNNEVNIDLDKIIISSLVCNNVEIPFFEIKTFNSQYMKR